MGALDDEQQQVSRRGFLGWGGTFLTALAIPGAAVMLTETSAAAALSPYALASWQALVERSVQAAAPGRALVAMKVVRVTNLATTTTKTMAGDVFSVGFQVTKPLAAGIYTVTAPNLGSFPLFITGNAATAQVVINRRLPVKS
jgi:hypothetical protein